MRRTPPPCSSTAAVDESPTRDAPELVVRGIAPLPGGTYVFSKPTPTTRQRRWIDSAHRPPIAIDRFESGRPLLARRGSRSRDLDRVTGQCPRQPGHDASAQLDRLIRQSVGSQTLHGPSRRRIPGVVHPGGGSVAPWTPGHVDRARMTGGPVNRILDGLHARAVACRSCRVPDGAHQRSRPC